MGPQLSAVEPLQRTGASRFLLGLAAYSFREYFGADVQRPNKAPPKDRRMDMYSFIDYCAEQGCTGAELTSYFLPKDISGDALQKIRRHAFLRGVAISGTAIANNFALPKGAERDEQIASVKKWIDHAVNLGAPHIRVFAGSAKGISDAEARALCIDALAECSQYAGDKGIYLGIENHGGIVAESAGLLEIIKAVDSQWLGINLDSGNFHTDDPYGDLALCAPYAVNVQIKVVMKSRTGEKTPTDYDRIVTILKDARYQGFVTLEYEEPEDAWIAVPRELEKLRKACQG
jgi:sugar phosphate isomerase/epimerase